MPYMKPWPGATPSLPSIDLLASIPTFIMPMSDERSPRNWAAWPNFGSCTSRTTCWPAKYPPN